MVKITILSGPEDGKIFNLNTLPINIGRHSDDEVYLPYSKEVSRHHAQIRKENSSWLIEDIGPDGRGSTNGTYLENKRINTPSAIVNGEFFLLANVWLKFEIVGK
jgi:pSer/pThr/pTyr-binding forkhead associated (FHA) protein